MTLWEINRISSGAFTTALGGIFEHSPWVAERASAARPFAGIAELHDAMMAAVRAAPDEMQLALIRAHPELAGKAAIRGELTPGLRAGAIEGGPQPVLGRTSSRA